MGQLVIPFVALGHSILLVQPVLDGRYTGSCAVGPPMSGALAQIPAITIDSLGPIRASPSRVARIGRWWWRGRWRWRWRIITSAGDYALILGKRWFSDKANRHD
ncbi:MAG: hypothetical protein SXU28_08760 [Pseudomonadota bacterium]|nr:hypothetical protein [Pseudomonadota bacterium]